MSTMQDLSDRVERLLVRHAETTRTNALLQQQLHAVTTERDSLRSRLQAARARVDALLDRLPKEGMPANPAQAFEIELDGKDPS